MGLISRFIKAAEARANKSVDKMEDPELMLEQALLDQEKAIAEMRRHIQSVIATERETKAACNKEESAAQDWSAKAEQAVTAGRDDLATKALMRSEEHQTNVGSLNAQWETLKREADQLKQTLKTAEDELEELRRNKAVLIARAKSAEVRKQVHETKAQIGSNQTAELIDRLKTKVERADHEAEAAREMAEMSQAGDSLEKEFQALDQPQTSSSVQERLAKMKAELKNRDTPEA